MIDLGSLIYGYLTVVMLTFAFQGLLFGNDLYEQSYPDFKPVDFGDCSGVGALEAIGCVSYNTFLLVINSVLFIYGTVVLAFNLISFNVPGAPAFARFLIAGIVGGGLVIAITIAVFRGGSASG